MRVTRSRYEEFLEGQTVYVLDTLEDSSDGATWAAKDVSSATLSVKFRAQTLPAGTGSSSWIIDQTMTKVDGAAGKVGAYVNFTADYGSVECMIVLVDSAVVNTKTTTGYRETIYKRWEATVRPCVSAS
jgi:hypothetical protein